MMKKKVFLILTSAFLAGSVTVLFGCGRNMGETSSNSSLESAPSSAQESNAPESTPELAPPTPPEPPAEPPVSSLPALSMSADFLEIGTLDNKPVAWGPGKLKDADGRATACVDLQAKYSQYDADFIGPNQKVVTLTFDQGYENGFTPAILDTLKEKNVQGIFFITGDYLRRAPELVQRMVDEGHLIGNHSDKHPNFTTIEPEVALADAKWVHDKMRADFDYEMRLFRFPEGAFSERALALMQQMGYRSIFWSFAYKDWEPNNQMEPTQAIEQIMKFVHPGEVMLLHTVGATNSLILGDVIDKIREQGYEIRPYDGIPQ